MNEMTMSEKSKHKALVKSVAYFLSQENVKYKDAMLRMLRASVSQEDWALIIHQAKNTIADKMFKVELEQTLSAISEQRIRGKQHVSNSKCEQN